MVSLNNVSFGYGGQAILDRASFTFNSGCRVGLIGPNGAGKSTIFRLITKGLQPDQGMISSGKNLKIEHFHQDLLSIETDDSIQKIVLQGFREILDIQDNIDKLLIEIEEKYTDKKIETLGALQNQFENLGGYTIQSKSEEILMGLGFSLSDLDRPLTEFSGGWRMRVLLGKILLSNPDLLLLDEPSNHLDLPSIEWLENYLSNFPGGFILISHDKRFLNTAVTEILEIQNQKLKSYKGNYSNYVLEKEQYEQIQASAFKNQQKQIKDTERFINRFRAKSTKAKQVQSRVKRLEKLEKVDEPDSFQSKLNIKFPISVKPGKILVESKGFSKSFDGLEIFRDAEFLVKRGDKIALIGANGKGKSTLLKILSDREKHDGNIEYGYNLNKDYFAQHQLEDLGLENKVLKEAMDGVKGKTEREVRDVLGSFLFSGEGAEKKVKVLSGGEKARLALAKIFLRQPNFLLLDEPTNHLDMTSIEVLRDALIGYEGSYIVVSHDRDFVEGVAQKIWWIDQQGIKEYPGDFEEYSLWKNSNDKKELGKSNFEKKERKKENANSTQKKNEEKLSTKNKSGKIASQLETDIEKIGKEIDVVEKEMIKNAQNYDEDKFSKLKKEYDRLRAKQEEMFEKWEGLVHGE
jgi:ATP-binding cassette, subfamily F, member 3